MRLSLVLLPCLAAVGCTSTPAWPPAAEVEPVLQREASDCGAAALATVLGTCVEDLRADFEIGPEGIAAATLRDVARARGWEAFVIRAERRNLEHELSRGRAVLVGVVRSGLPHYVVVAGLHAERNTVYLMDPARGRCEQAWPRFQREWDRAANLALVLFRSEESAILSP